MPYTLEQCGWLRRSELDDLHRGDVWEHPNGLLYILYPIQMSLAERSREGANIVTPKKWRPLNLGLIGRQKRFSRACREGKPARKRQHLRLDGGHYR